MVTEVGPYKVLELLGTDVIGDVYRARDTRMGRTVCLTLISQDVWNDPSRREPLLDNARRCLQLSHPNVTLVHEVSDADPPFIATEFVRGEALVNVLAGRPLHPRRALECAAQIADGLADAHGLALSPGSLNTASVMIATNGTAKIINFGREGAVRSASVEGDLAALGGVLAEMLTGKNPGPAADAVPSSVPPSLRTIVGRLLGTGDRPYPSAAVAAAELRLAAQALDQRQEEMAGTIPVRAGSTPRSRWMIGLIVFAIAALMLLIWLLTTCC